MEGEGGGKIGDEFLRSTEGSPIKRRQDGPEGSGKKLEKEEKRPSRERGHEEMEGNSSVQY